MSQKRVEKRENIYRLEVISVYQDPYPDLPYDISKFPDNINIHSNLIGTLINKSNSGLKLQFEKQNIESHSIMEIDESYVIEMEFIDLPDEIKRFKFIRSSNYYTLAYKAHLKWMKFPGKNHCLAGFQISENNPPKLLEFFKDSFYKVSEEKGGIYDSEKGFIPADEKS